MARPQNQTTITIEGTDYETTTNSNGDFTLQNVQPGEYT